MIAAAILASLAVPTRAYTSRELPSHEWPRLAGTELETLWPKLRADQTRIVVVEYEGAIVGAWAVVQMVHVEGLWIAPAHRKRMVVGRRLWRGMQAAARAFKASAVWTGAETDDIRALLDKQGACRVPFESYVLPVGE